MDNHDFKQIAGPILAGALAKANKITCEYYSPEYFNALPPSKESAAEFRNKARRNIGALNSLKGKLEPKEGGLLSVDMPSPLKGASDEWEDFRVVDSIKDDLISNLCSAYGLDPPPVRTFSQSVLEDQSSLKDLIVHLAAENLKTSLKAQPRGGKHKSKEQQEYDWARDKILAEAITQIKLELKPKSSDEKVVSEIIRQAGKKSEFNKNCLRFRNFYINVKSGHYHSPTINNRITAARKRSKYHK